jgi:hypothetical protein
MAIKSRGRTKVAAKSKSLSAQTNTPTPVFNVYHMRAELVDALPVYQLISDCLGGEYAVKLVPKTYLPMPNAADTSKPNLDRYDAYVLRAVFYNVTGRTREGLSGQIFVRDPHIKVPTTMDAIVADSNGAGLSLIQSAKQAVDHVLAFGRAGIFVDYPQVDGPVTREDIVNGVVRPTVSVYGPTDIINWRTITRGAQQLISLVVLSETYTWEDDGFLEYRQRQFRVLRLETDTGFYRVELWKSKTRAGTNYELDTRDIHYPKDANGKNLMEIPFTFIGSRNNDAGIDSAPFASLAGLNIAHYRNSADYEEACFTVGQPTLFVAGLTEEWFKNVLLGVIPFGSRVGVPLNEGAVPHLLQVAANTMPFEAMKHKEAQMLAIGANLVDDKQRIPRTATDAVIQANSELSTLASSAQNISEAYTFALQWCAAFLGLPETEVEFELNTDFSITKLSAADRLQAMQEWQAGGVAFKEYRDQLRKSGIATLDDATAQEQIQSDAILSLAEFNPNLASPTAPPGGQNPAGGDTPNPGRA